MTLDEIKAQKNTLNLTCEECNFKCCKQSDYKRHLMTNKHKRMTNDDKKEQKSARNDNFICECGKRYKYRQGLHKHRKICPQLNISDTFQENPEEKPSFMDIITQNKEIMDALVLQNEQLMKQNTELTNTIKEIVPRIGNNNTTTNNTNNQFNLQVFLNEDCKDAINFSEFIENIKISFEDLENQAEIGYINGISKLFIENLQELGTYKRPIHCTDKKRKTLYIKENNEWDKEGSQNTLKKGIQEVSRKGFECLSKEKKENQEEYEDIESDFSQKCLTIQRNLIPNAPRDITINKVIEKISKNSGIIE